MKSSEIIVMTFSIGAAFFISFIAVDYSMVQGAFMRFFLRTVIQFVLFTLIYLALDSADMSERLRERDTMAETKKSNGTGDLNEKAQL